MPDLTDIFADGKDEVSQDVALQLEAWTDESRAELFQRACRVLRAEGIRVKQGYAPTMEADPLAARALSGVLYPDRG